MIDSSSSSDHVVGNHLLSPMRTTLLTKARFKRSLMSGKRIWWTSLLLLLLLLIVWPTITHSSITTIEGDDDNNNNDDDDDDDDDNVVAMDTMTTRQHDYRPYSLNLGVPQNLDGLDSNELDDMNNDDLSVSTHRHSTKEMEDYMEETEEYFRTEVLNVLKTEQVERCKDYHEDCVVWSLNGECTKDEEFMGLNCAASCRVCHTVLPDEDLCFYVENGPDIWKPGDLDHMFRRILVDFQKDDQYTLQVISSPDTTNVTSEDGTIQKGPWIISIDNYLNSTEIERLIELGALEGYQRSTMHDRESDEDAYRTSSNSWCSQDSCAKDPIAKNVLQRIFDMTQIPEDYSEEMQMLHYQPGQYYKVHHDFLQYGQEEVMQIGDRILTVFLYLNEVEEGGGTSFPELNVTVLPKPGRVVIWPSVLDSSPKEIDWNTEHEANKVTKGEKYGANVWFHLKPFRLAYTHYQCCKTRRTYVENGPDAWKSGDLDKMFQRIVQDPNFQAEFHTQVLSSPEMTYSSSNEDVDNIRKPWIVMLENFITPNEAERLIELGAEAGYTESEINDEDSDNDGTDEKWRTSMTSWCRDECMEDPVAESVLERIYNLTEFDDPYTENMQFLKYEKGQFYKPHKDYMDLSDEDEKQVGNRILTVFLYLSDVEEGGQTSFTALNLTVHPKVGRVLIWPNVLNDDPTEIELLTEHESLPVEKGTKYGANVWFQMKPSTTAYKEFTCDDGEEERETLEDLVDEPRGMENERTTHGYDETVGSEL